MRNEDETLPAADEGPVQRTVRPTAWVRDLGPQPHCVTDLRYCAASDVERGAHLNYLPLYDHAAIGAAVAAEHERLRAYANAAHWWAEAHDNELAEAGDTRFDARSRMIDAETALLSAGYVFSGPNAKVTGLGRNRSNDER